MFTELFPIISTGDIARALGFYRDALGGRVTHEVAGVDGAPAYVGIDVGTSHLGIGLGPPADGERTGPIRVWLHAEDCDAAIEWLRRNDVVVVEDPKDQPSGERVARVLDPDGNEVVISERRGTDGAIDSVGASLLSPEPARYTRPEFERRFLVSPTSAWRAVVEPYSKTFEDTYIRRTHLRLRVLSDSSTGQEFVKLTKKLESASPYVQMTGSIPLSPLEFEFLAELPGDRIRKVRYYHIHQGYVFSIDVFRDELEGLVMCEVEAAGVEDLMQIEMPAYAVAEVTEDPFFKGGNLCRTTAEELARRLGGIQ